MLLTNSMTTAGKHAMAASSNTQYGGARIPSKTSIHVKKLPRQATYENLEELFSKLVPHSHIVQIRICKVSAARKYRFVDFADDVFDKILPQNENLPWPFRDDPVLLLLEKAKRHDRKPSKTSIYIRQLPRHATYQHLEDLFSKLVPRGHILQIRIIKLDTGRKYGLIDFEDNVLDQLLPHHERVEWPFGEDAELELEEATATEIGNKHGSSNLPKTSIYVRNLPQEATYEHLEELFYKIVPQSEIAQIRIHKNESGQKYGFVDFEDDVLDRILPMNENVPWIFSETPVLKLEAATTEISTSRNAVKNVRNQATSSARDEQSYSSSSTNGDESQMKLTPTRSLYVGNLPEETQEHHLFDLGKQVVSKGRVTRVRMKGQFAFIDFEKDVLHGLKIVMDCSWETGTKLHIEAPIVERSHVDDRPLFVARPANRKDALIVQRSHAPTVQRSHADNRPLSVARPVNRGDSKGKASSITSIYIKNLPHDSNVEDICDLFKDLCPKQTITSVRFNGKGNCYGFADFDSDVRHLFGGRKRLSTPCTWARTIVLELEAAKNKSVEQKQTSSNRHETYCDGDSEDERSSDLEQRGGDDHTAYPTICVRNLPRRTSNQQIANLFEQICPNVKVQRIWISSVNASKYAYVQLSQK